MATTEASTANTEELESVVIRFAGDSGDGIQVTGSRFTSESAIAGNDIVTLPNFPAEIRAPAGTLAGVSGFQINFGSLEINTAGDVADVLVAMNPAALKANLSELRPGGILIINEDSFTEKNLARVDYQSNPVDDKALQEKFKIIVVPITRLTKDALADTDLTAREVERCKNFFTLGIVLWMFNRPHESTIEWIRSKFKKNQKYVDANIAVLKGGMAYAEATELIPSTFSVKPAKLEAGEYRNINGTLSAAYGFIAAAQKSKLPVFFGAYPITPASDLLHELANHKRFGISTFQAEDEIAAICASIGAAFAGQLAITSSSGPGIALKTEALALAVITELPLVIVNVQRAGPSTGMPTKTEQADLFQALYGRPGETPLCVLAPSTPSTAFTCAYEACRIALKYMTPVMLLSDNFVANSSEPWLIPDPAKLPDFEFEFTKKNNNPDGKFLPFLRDEKTLARPWAIPGTPGLTHRIGGLEKEDKTGNVSYDPDNHHLMTTLRAEKIARIADEIPPIEIDGDKNGDLLLIGWGGTEGSIRQACVQARKEGMNVSRIHIHHLNPLPRDLGEVISNFKNVLIPEINMGQLKTVIRDKYLVDAKGFNMVRGAPIRVSELVDEIKKIVRPN